MDFDGTLAPIVDDPSSSAPLPSTIDALDRLAGRMGLVAVVTGRPVDFVRRHLDDPRVQVVGQYGLERDRGGTVEPDPRAVPYEAPVAAAADEAERRWPALIVERKGRVAVTLHWRVAPDRAPSDAELARLADAHGLARFPGRMACELRPPLPVDKGTAVTALLSSAGDLAAAAFAGDDHGDLTAFVALAEWAAGSAGRIALRVAVASEESPDELRASADLVVDGPSAFARELTRLADDLG